MVLGNYGLGMSDYNLSRIPQIGDSWSNNAFAKKYSGRILLQVEDMGQAWYVNPVNLHKYYLGRSVDALRVMRGLGLGISNANLQKIPADRNYQEVDTTRNFHVTLRENSFNPYSLEIKRGDTITWTNKGYYNHTVSTTNKKLVDFGSGTLAPKKSYSYTFNQSGIYDYNCLMHASMIGRVIVR
jgi:plastocyanin